MSELDLSTSNADTSKIVADHYNKLPEKGLASRVESRIFHMRNFNNWIKSMLIGDFIKRVRPNSEDKQLNVLDIGAGKGGDLIKWKKGRINHLICADIAATSLEQLQQRYSDMKGRDSRYDKIFTLQCIPADCTKVRLKDHFDDKNIQFDLVSIQFSFHYCFESFPQVECMIRNASESLREGGFLVGTTPDANDIVKRLRDSPSLSFGNDVYSVTFKSKDDFPLFGTQYDFHLEGVVDCPEFLVHFPTFVEIAARYGLKLLFKKRFDEFFEDYKDTKDGSMLLGVMQALETFPALDGNKSVSESESDYKHAQSEIEKLKSKGGREETRVGTMSQSEWDAISLYLVFAFVKEKVPDQTTT